MNTAECNAYAKINLSLDITGRREDGYHTVDMVMQSVSLCDRVRVTLNDTGEVILKCSKPHIPCDGRNTAYKAAQYYFDATGVPFGADIYIEKHIPDQAGMGGGSADAAAVLKLLNHLCAEAGEEPLNTAELLYLGLRIGADVPFCILSGTYRCLGIGEQLLPLAEMPKCYLVVVKPDVGVSTPEAYRACENVPGGGMRYTPGMVCAVEHRSIEEIANALGNRFDDALQISVVQEIKKYLCENGALNALMTGSGSGYIVLMICPEKDMYKVLESYKKNLECFLPRAETLRDYAWFGGHSIQENGCDEQHQQDYLAGRSVYYNPLRLEIVQDMVVLCEKLITGEISKADVMSTDEHYCNYGSAGMYFRFI